MALATSSPVSIGSSTVMVITPRSAFLKTRNDRFAKARCAPPIESAVPQRNSRHRSSTRAFVVFNANEISSSSFPIPATRVMARTFEYESSPEEKEAESAGNVFSACATRTFSREAFIEKSQ
jgi:hypothetical protein